MNINAVMDALGTRLATIDELRVYDYPPESVAVPAAVIGYPDTIGYDQTYAAGTDVAVFKIHVVVGKVSDRAARDAIGVYVARDGDPAIKTVLEDDPTLGGAAKTLRVTQAVFSTITVGQVDYLAATFDVEVYA